MAGQESTIPSHTRETVGKDDLPPLNRADEVDEVCDISKYTVILCLPPQGAVSCIRKRYRIF